MNVEPKPHRNMWSILLTAGSRIIGSLVLTIIFVEKHLSGIQGNLTILQIMFTLETEAVAIADISLFPLATFMIVPDQVSLSDLALSINTSTYSILPFTAASTSSGKELTQRLIIPDAFFWIGPARAIYCFG